MSTPYQRGTAFEHRVKAELEKEGYLVVRSPASKSALDLLAVKRGAIAFIQCKLRGKITRAEGEALIRLGVEYGGLAIMAYTLQQRGEIHFRILAGMKRWSP